MNLYKIVYGHELPCRLTLFTSLLRMNHLSDGDADASPDTKTKVESITFHMSGMAWLPLQGHDTATETLTCRSHFNLLTMKGKKSETELTASVLEKKKNLKHTRH